MRRGKILLVKIDILEYRARGYIASKFPSLRSISYKYMSLEEIIEYEKLRQATMVMGEKKKRAP